MKISYNFRNSVANTDSNECVFEKVPAGTCSHPDHPKGTSGSFVTRALGSTGNQPRRKLVLSDVKRRFDRLISTGERVVFSPVQKIVSKFVTKSDLRKTFDKISE
jgi:hypothetical protein